MRRKANPTIIGAFIFGALMLLIVGIVFLSPDIGADREHYQLYFEGSVKGLNVGAPVLVKGVRVGTVRDIHLRVDSSEADRPVAYVVPVIVELSRRHLLPQEEGSEVSISDLIQKGLRAQLELDSFITQKLFVELEFRPDTEARFHTTEMNEMKEIPTMQTAWQTLQADLEELDIAHLVSEASSALETVNRILNAPEVMQTLGSLEQALRNINVLVTDLSRDRERLTESIDLTLTDTRDLVSQIESTVTRADQVVANLDDLTGDDSPTVDRVELALDEITGTAKTLRRFVEMLERKPDALVRGL